MAVPTRLLGPSGCGKTTLLNCTFGFAAPVPGRILFDSRDVTDESPQARNIAQVFQFPVIYDTMTVGENLAFPLRNRGVPRGAGPRAGRARGGDAGLVCIAGPARERAGGRCQAEDLAGPRTGAAGVSAILFDEPLTVIDPQLKWQLRRKLKEIHHEFRLTLIYVTHDQTEALTFADQVVVMSRGKAVQIGAPDALFERPAHTFVGHFIGSPGMSFLPASWRDGAVRWPGAAICPRCRMR
ncbi:ABC transporter ATP-binding protein [Cupriavidus basilensis]